MILCHTCLVVLPNKLCSFTGDISPVTELETVWENVVVLVGACFLAGLIGKRIIADRILSFLICSQTFPTAYR